MHAHRAIIEQRAPGFYRRYLASAIRQKSAEAAAQTQQPTGGTKFKAAQIVLKDIDFPTLKFFLSSIYTEDEIPANPDDMRSRARDGQGGGGSESGM